MRIGVFGGAFDPPHLAHQTLARIALAELCLDKLIIVPSGSSPHKLQAMGAASHRLEMSRLAFEGLGPVEIDDCEVRREGVSYTIETLQSIGARYGRAKFFLIIGEDQAEVFDTWHEWRSILQLATLAVAARSPVNLDAADPLKDGQTQVSPLVRGSDHLTQQAVDSYDLAPRMELSRYRWHNQVDMVGSQSMQSLKSLDPGVAVVLHMPAMSISATLVRKLIQDRADCTDLVDPFVLSYIEHHGVYSQQSCNE